MKIERPTTITNHGTKMIVEFIVNPQTGRWEAVWGDKPWNQTWIRDYLKFEGDSDNVHNGESLKILKPVTVAFEMFGHGETTVEVDHGPTNHVALQEAPILGSICRVNFEPSTRQGRSENAAPQAK